MSDISPAMAEAGAKVIKERGTYFGFLALALAVYEAMDAQRVSPQTAGRDLVEENARLREALKPFAEYARVTRSDTLGNAGWRDDTIVAVADQSWGTGAAVTLGDFGRAMEVLQLSAAEPPHA